MEKGVKIIELVNYPKILKLDQTEECYEIIEEKDWLIDFKNQTYFKEKLRKEERKKMLKWFSWLIVQKCGKLTDR